MRLGLKGCVAVIVFLSAGLAASQTTDADAASRLFQKQDWAGAAAAYEKLARAQPKDPTAHFRLGVALQSLGKHEEAARALESAEKLGSPSPATQWRLAQVYARLRRKDDALGALQRAADAGFGSINVLENDPDIGQLAADARLAPIKKAVDRNERPCVYASEYRQLDFWIGDWDVASAVGPTTGPPSRSRVELIEDQCVIFETYSTSGGYSGRSFNTYHPDKKHWEQFWVDNKGTIHHYVGRFQDGNLYYEADDVRTLGPASPLAKVKMTFFNQGPEQVRQLGEQSTDGGRTWVTAYDLIYRRRKR